MSEQQSLHHATMFNSIANNRPPDANMMHAQYYHPNPRLDGISLPQNPAPMQNIPLPVYPVRASDMSHCMFRQLGPQYLYSYMPSLPETQLTGQMPSAPDYTHITMPPQPYPYQQITAPQPVSTHAPVTQLSQHVPNYVFQSKFVLRKKCPLVVCDPVTHAEVDYQSSNSGDISTSSSKSSAAAVESSQSPEMTAPQTANTTENRSTEQSSPVPRTDVEGITSLFHGMFDLKLSEPNVDEEDGWNDVLFKNGSGERDLYGPCELFGDSDVDESEEEDGDYESDPIVEKFVYDRDTLLSFKNCSVSQIPLQDLARLDHLRVRYSGPVHRPANRTGQRIIRLPTGMTVKRIEGAFVPSSLRKKDGETDLQKQLSRELNILLNRVSDSNLPETIGDIRKLNINSIEDLHMLSKLVFQKAIRQPKYSKVFAILCKELRTLEVPGSDQFDVLILRQVHELFNTPLDNVIVELNNLIDEKIKNAKDDAIKKILEEDRETNIIKKKEAYYGNMTLLAELHLSGLVTLKTMTECLKRLKSSVAPEALSSMLILLEICGQDLDQKAKATVDQSFNRLNTVMNSPETPSHQVYKIQELVDLRSRDWKPLNRTVPTRFPTNINHARRMTEDKLKRPVIEKRKTLPSNLVTPTNLAVSTQSNDIGRLGPSVNNWTQGSGTQRNADDRYNQRQMLVNNRSREASPRVTQHNVWVDRQSKQKENYDIVLQRNRPRANKIIVMLGSQDDDPSTVIDECKPDERSAVLHIVFEKLMDERESKRKAAGDFCVNLLEKRSISTIDIVNCCSRYLATCTEDWLADYPKGWFYLAEIFERLITESRDNFDLLVGMLRPLIISGNAALVFAHCLSLSAGRLGNFFVSDRFKQRRMDWITLGVPDTNLHSFLEKHDVSFTVSDDRFASDLREMETLAESSSNGLEQFTDYFKNLPTDLPLNFIRSCTKTLINESKNISRGQIDARVIALNILVNHNPDRESQVLQGLQDCSAMKIPTEQWQRSLVDRKVISVDAFETWSKSGNANASITRKLPFHNR